MKYTSFKVSIASILASLPGILGAQTILLDWDQNWNYFHPTAGILPDGSGTPHPEGSTPWFASEAEFNASYSGPSFTTSGQGFESGIGQGPIGYGASINYIQNTANPEFQALGTRLSSPGSGERFTAYFRTTFTVPDDGNFYVNPSIRYLLDDGGFVYLDGELVLAINVAQGSPDYYTIRAEGTFATETVIRTADLSLPVGTRTGGNADVDPAIGANATLISSINRLAPGEHTLAVSVHNADIDSPDLAMAVQLVVESSDCLITASASSSTRDLNGTRTDPDDDTISADVTVVPEGTTAATWQVTGPAGSALIGTTGAYNTPVTLQNIPISEFASGSLVVEIADANNANCTTTVEILPQRIIGVDAISGSPIVTTGKLDTAGWDIDESTLSLTLNSPGGNAPLYTITSSEIDLTGQPDVRFTGNLFVLDDSNGAEAGDIFNAFLILDGDIDNPVILIDRHDIVTRDGRLTGAELASESGTFARTLDAIIPASANSARLVIQGLSDSSGETFVVGGIGFAVARPSLEAYALPPVYNNRGTDDPDDDVFTSDFVITAANLGASTGWTSNEAPTSGLYSDASPVTFGPFPATRAPLMVTLTDELDPTKTASIPLTIAAPTLTALTSSRGTRVENGPGPNDDTLTVEVEILGTNGGPGWKVNSDAVSPNSGDFGRVTFTISAPLVEGEYAFEIVDRSYPDLSQVVTVNVPGRYVIGQSDLSGSLEDISTHLTFLPPRAWTNDKASRTMTRSVNSRLPFPDSFTSEPLDLSAIQEKVYFSAIMRPSETRPSSNFRSDDRFSAQLIYTTAEFVVVVVDLVGPYDTGDGSPATTGTSGGVNGSTNGFINGYTGAIGTDLVTGAVYATPAEDYDANLIRDEFNRNGANAASLISPTFRLTAEIPAEAVQAFVIIGAQGFGDGASITISDLLFSTKPFSVDSDADGIPDDYETANGLNPSDPSDRDTDLDKDGQSNYAEFLAGTVANDATSNLRITRYSVNGNIISAFWSSVPGRTYRIEFSTDLVNWTDLGVDFPAANPPLTETGSSDFDLTGIGAPAEAYFRVVVVQ